MKVYLHWSMGYKFCAQQRLEGIYDTRAAAKLNLPHNPKTSNRDHWIQEKTVKSMPKGKQ